jgi:hypothetical protein|tara:strand:+ start:215 stop:586 length:372 start_codon:yes stop_codon:yes gene_type:complete
VTILVFGDKDAVGKIDAAGIIWKGLNVAGRIGKLKNRIAPLSKLLKTSPAEYEYRVKDLYSRLRNTYERTVEEIIFKDFVRRTTDVIQIQLRRALFISATKGLARKHCMATMTVWQLSDKGCS